MRTHWQKRSLWISIHPTIFQGSLWGAICPHFSSSHSESANIFIHVGIHYSPLSLGHNYTPLCGWSHLHGHLIHPCIEESGKASYLLPIKRLHRFHCIQIKLRFCLGLVTVTMIHEYDHHYVHVNKNLANRSMTNVCWLMMRMLRGWWRL